jgi:hypothetical protein
MKTYTVIKMPAIGVPREEKTFSSFSKALLYIEQELDGIERISKYPDGKWWQAHSYEKRCYSEIAWNKMVLNSSEAENTTYGKFYQGDEYVIKVRKVY